MSPCSMTMQEAGPIGRILVADVFSPTPVAQCFRPVFSQRVRRSPCTRRVTCRCGASPGRATRTAASRWARRRCRCAGPAGPAALLSSLCLPCSPTARTVLPNVCMLCCTCTALHLHRPPCSRAANNHHPRVLLCYALQSRRDDDTSHAGHHRAPVWNQVREGWRDTCSATQGSSAALPCAALHCVEAMASRRHMRPAVHGPALKWPPACSGAQHHNQPVRTNMAI